MPQATYPFRDFVREVHAWRNVASRSALHLNRPRPYSAVQEDWLRHSPRGAVHHNQRWRHISSEDPAANNPRWTCVRRDPSSNV
eukprot:7379122-Pyramimonas_sp.AAC.1